MDPSDGWTVSTGSGATAVGATVAEVGSELQFTVPSNASMRIQGSQMKGIMMCRSLHIEPWQDAGISKPVGADDHQFEPEAVHLKIEVEFATDSNGPICSGSVGSGDGTYLTCLVGLAGFPTDQAGNPVHSTLMRWSAAQVRKNYGGDPATDTRVNMYTSGYKSYNTNSGLQGTAMWKNQQGAGAGHHNAIVYATSPLRKEAATPYGRCNIQGGSYDNTDPFGGMCMLNQQLFDNSTKFTNPAIFSPASAGPGFWHIALWFGTHTNAGGKGQVLIKRIRYCLQPVQHRSEL